MQFADSAIAQDACEGLLPCRMPVLPEICKGLANLHWSYESKIAPAVFSTKDGIVVQPDGSEKRLGKMPLVDNCGREFRMVDVKILFFEDVQMDGADRPWRGRRDECSDLQTWLPEWERRDSATVQARMRYLRTARRCVGRILK